MLTQLPLRRPPALAACPAISAHTQGDSLACRVQMARGNVESTESATNCVSCSVFLVPRSAKLFKAMPIIWEQTCPVRCDGLHQAASQPKHQFEAFLACRALLRISTVPCKRKSASKGACTCFSTMSASTQTCLASSSSRSSHCRYRLLSTALCNTFPRAHTDRVLRMTCPCLTCPHVMRSH